MYSYFINRTACGLAVCLLLALGADAVQAAPGVELRNKTKVTGTSIRVKSNGDVVLNTPQGTRTFTPDQILRAWADKPDAYDQALRDANAKQFDKAVAALEQIAKEYKSLEWDLRALNALGKIQVERGHHDEAITAYETLFKSAPSTKKGDARWGYYEALLGAEKYNSLKQELDEVISSGSRSDAAKAQIVRGDIQAAQGSVEDAAIDYLKTVILYEAEKQHQPEALYKSGKSLKTLRDKRADEMFAELDRYYADSKWAKQPR